MLELPLAALLLARDNNINIRRYSTEEQRAQIRHAQGAGPAAPPVAPSTTPTTSERPARSTKKASASPRAPKDNSVFVVHGRNVELRKAFFAFLRALGVNPMEWSTAVATAKGANPYVGDILDSAMAKVQAVVVLFSPDDLAQLRPEFLHKGEKTSEGRPRGQARANVLFEAGLAFGRHQDKTLLVQVGTIKPFSDIGGRHIVRLGNSVEQRSEVANRLVKIGCKVDRTRTDWMTEGDLTA